MDIPLDDQIVFFSGGVIFYLGFFVVSLAIRVFRKLATDHSPEL